MEDNLIELLEALGYPVFRQGSLTEDTAYPDTFLTFWNRSTDGESYYDNEAVSYTAAYYINAYSTDPATAYSLLRSAKMTLKANGYSIPRWGYDVASDEVTHTGRGMEATILHFEED